MICPYFMWLVSSSIRSQFRDFNIQIPLFHFHACGLRCFSRVQLLATLWTLAHEAPLSMGFSRQEYWSGLPCPPPGDLPNPGIEPASLASPALEADFLPLYHLGNPTLDSFINSSVVSFTHCGKTGVSLLPKLFPS